MNPGDDVTVDFDGLDHDGVIERIEHGWAICTIIIDTEPDYGSGTERLSPYQTVAVPIARVTPRE